MTKSRARKFADIMGGTFVGLIEDGQIDLVDVDGLSAIQTKVNGIEENATADQTPAQIKTAYESNANTNEFSDAEQSKLAGIEANAKDDQTITAGSGLTGGGTGNVTLDHADTSSVSNANNSGNTFIQDINFDGFGHVTSVGTGTVSVGDGTLTVQGTGALGGSGTFTANQSGDSTISISHDDTSSQGSVDNSGATVVQDVTLDDYGHVTGLGSHTLTLANLGYTGATNANYITNNNQLTNGAGYTTNVGDITNVTAGTNLTGGGSSGSVTVNLTASPNITSLNVGGSEVVSSSRALKNISSVDATTVAALGAAGVGGSVDSGTTLPSNASGGVGDLFFLTTSFQLYIHNGTAWKEFSGQSFNNYTAIFYNRLNSSVSSTVPNTGGSSGGWGFGGSNVDAVTINMSGIGTYKLGGLGMGVWASSPPSSTAIRVLVAQGSDTGGTQVFEGAVSLPANDGHIDFSSSPVTLNKGTTYTVGFSFPSGVSGSQARNFTGLSTTMSGSLGTLTVGTATFGGSNPYSASNGTSNTAGQHPFFNFST